MTQYPYSKITILKQCDKYKNYQYEKYLVQLYISSSNYMQQTNFYLRLVDFKRMVKKTDFFLRLIFKFCDERLNIPKPINTIKVYKNNCTHFNSVITFLKYFTSLLLSTLTR